ncbi:MAG: hypothetical protein WD226_13495 [Planctomycetota bacterium]
MSLRRSAVLFPALLAGLLSFGSCQSAPSQEHVHWNLESVGQRMSYSFLGYREDIDGSWRDKQWEDKQNINRTLRRHFLNNNPENPFQAEDPNVGKPRPPHSILPSPLHYFHLESLAFGAGMSALTGAFIPIPVGSLLGTFEEGGFKEFGDGIVQSLTFSYDNELPAPPPVEDFRIKNETLRMR